MQFFLPMKSPPTATHQEKKVTAKSGKPRYYEPDNVERARAIFRAALAEHRPLRPLRGPLRMTCRWCFPPTKSHHAGEWKQTRPDLDNMQKLLNDCLTDLCFWHDDAQVASMLLEKAYNEIPGVFIQIESL